MDLALEFFLFVAMVILVGIALIAGIVFSIFAFRDDVSPNQGKPGRRAEELGINGSWPSGIR